MAADRTTAVVAGGTGALGGVTVRALRNAGYAVAVPVRAAPGGGRRGDSVDQVLYIPASITSEADVTAFYHRVEAELGAPTILVHAAGGYVGGKTVDAMSVAEWESAFTMNLTTAFLMIREALRFMKTRGEGRIITIAAKTALVPEPGKGAYAAAKRALITLTETVAREVRGTGITANAIAPAVILTEANREWMSPGAIGNAVPPGEIAALITYLCSDAARSISGNTIRIYGTLS
jgi:NAD(P)-dependent dehydrogenase (short-subunit alcohol dehydrogenase family)